MSTVVEYKKENPVVSGPGMVTHFQVIDQHLGLTPVNWIFDKVLVAILSLNNAGNEFTIGCYRWRILPVFCIGQYFRFLVFVVEYFDLAAVDTPGVIGGCEIDKGLRWMKEGLVIVTLMFRDIHAI